MMILIMTIPCDAAYVTAESGLNVRQEPSTNSEIVDVKAFRSVINGTEKDGWIKIPEGYVKAEYVAENDPVEDYTLLGTWTITAYAYTGSPCANGNYPQEGYTIACNALPFGSRVYIDGVGFRVVEDTDDGHMGNEWCDLYMESVTDCVQWGMQERQVWLIE